MFKRDWVVLLLILASACGGTTTTSPTPLTSNGEAFSVTGAVTDDQGVPVAGAEVTMSYWLGGIVRRPSVRTDASGGYTIALTSNPYMNGTNGSRGAARAEVVGIDLVPRFVAREIRVRRFTVMIS